MPIKGFKSITVREEVFDNLKKNRVHIAYHLEKMLEEKEVLKRFASKITKYPETIRVYTNPFMVEEKK